MSDLILGVARITWFSVGLILTFGYMAALPPPTWIAEIAAAMPEGL